MATGRSLKLTNQIGKHLVAAELCRRGFLPTILTDRTLHYHIVATDDANRKLAVHVKTVRSGDWQFDIKSFARLQVSDGVQTLGGSTPEPTSRLLCIFVRIHPAARDRYFILPWKTLQHIIITRYSRHLDSIGGRRAKTASASHTMLKPAELAEFEDKWHFVAKALSPKD